MASITRTPSGTWKAVIRKTGWPTTVKTFRLKRDAEDWARRTEDEMVRGVHIQRAPSEKMTVEAALKRYLAEVSPTKRPATARGDRLKAKPLTAFFGKYSLAAVSAELVARYRDERLAGDENKDGERVPRTNNTVRLELALLSHMFTVAIKEWGIGLVQNPVSLIRKPSPGEGRKRRLGRDEEKRLLEECDKHCNPMLGWIVRLALYTGMRSGEILSLERNQVDLDRRRIILNVTKNGSARTVPLTREAVEVLREAMNNPVRPIDTDLIFFGEPGKDKKRRPLVFHNAWREALRNASIANLHFHDLRHEAISRFVERGLSDQEVMAISGHRSAQMLARYAHLRTAHLIGKLDRVAAAS